MCHIIRASRVLAPMMDSRYALTYTLDEGGDDDDEGDDHDHDHEGGDHDSSSSTTPSDHGCQDGSDPSSSTPPHYLSDVEMLEPEDVPYVSPDRAKKPPPPPPQIPTDCVETVVGHRLSSTANHLPPPDPPQLSSIDIEGVITDPSSSTVGEASTTMSVVSIDI